MIESSLAHTPAPYTLRRVNQDGTEQFVSDHPDFAEGWDAGTTAAHAEPQAAFSLYRGERRVARFCHHRLTSNDASANLDALAQL